MVTAKNTTYKPMRGKKWVSFPASGNPSATYVGKTGRSNSRPNQTAPGSLGKKPEFFGIGGGGKNREKGRLSFKKKKGDKKHFPS